MTSCHVKRHSFIVIIMLTFFLQELRCLRPLATRIKTNNLTVVPQNRLHTFIPVYISPNNNAGSCLAVVWRRFKEDQILVAGSFEAAVGGYQWRTLPVKLDQRRTVVTLFETVPGLSEWRQLMPTRLRVTGSRHTVTFALGLGVLVHCLHLHTKFGHWVLQPDNTNSHTNFIIIIILYRAQAT